jgi:Zn-dependent peptidase ImmA (M78 family)
MSYKSDAKKDAERILKTTWGGEDEIPVDPVRIARKLGIDVVNAQLDPNVAGALVKEVGQDPIIFLNSNDAPNRKRFSCAHEIGHYVKRSDQPDQYEYIDLRDSLASAGSDSEEIYANAFAASLLMPEKTVRKLRRRGHSELELAVRFDVSREAMHYRLKNLDLL